MTSDDAISAGATDASRDQPAGRSESAVNAHLARQGGIAVITLDAAPVNAMSWSLRRCLFQAVPEAASDPSVCAIVLNGAGRGFCAGGDLREAGTDTVMREPRISDHLLPQLEQAGKPVIAAIHGFAVGGGFEIALACHARVAQADAQIGLPETRRGLIALSGSQRLPRALPFEAALRMLVDGLTVQAASLAYSAIFDRVVPRDALGAAVELANEFVTGRSALGSLLRDRDLCTADRADARQRVEAERETLLRNGALHGVDRAAALATLEALDAACTADEFDIGLARAAELYVEMNRIRGERSRATGPSSEAT